MSSSNSVAECPICSQSVAIDAINSHIDVCLLPGGRNLPLEEAQTGSKVSRKIDSSFVPIPHPKKKQSPLSARLVGKKRLLGEFFFLYIYITSAHAQ